MKVVPLSKNDRKKYGGVLINLKHIMGIMKWKSNFCLILHQGHACQVSNLVV